MHGTPALAFTFLIGNFFAITSAGFITGHACECTAAAATEDPPGLIAPCRLQGGERASSNTALLDTLHENGADLMACKVSAWTTRS